MTAIHFARDAGLRIAAIKRDGLDPADGMVASAPDVANEDVLAALCRCDDAVGMVFVAIEDEDRVEIGPLRQGEGIVVAIGIRYPIAVADRA